MNRIENRRRDRKKEGKKKILSSFILGALQAGGKKKRHRAAAITPCASVKIFQEVGKEEREEKGGKERGVHLHFSDWKRTVLSPV